MKLSDWKYHSTVGLATLENGIRSSCPSTVITQEEIFNIVQFEVSISLYSIRCDSDPPRGCYQRWHMCIFPKL